MTDLFAPVAPLTPSNGDTIVVWFSHGAASAVAWKLAEQKYGNLCHVLAVNNPVTEEDEDNARFGRDVSAWVGRPLIEHRNPKWPKASAVEVWEHERAMSFPHGAPCTDELKKKARQDFERCRLVHWHVLGFAADERHRYDRFVLTERSNVLPILIDAGLTKQGCMDMIVAAGLLPPRIYLLGGPNGNCPGCVKATSPTYWNWVRQHYPVVFKQRAELSRRLGVRLVRYKGERIFLDELPPSAVGRPLKSMRIECGSFCEEWPLDEGAAA